MKRLVLTLLVLSSSFSLKGQIQKEHTFNSNTVRYSQVEKNRGYYSVLNGQTVRFYKTDYTLYKQLTLPQKSNSEPISITRLNNNLFDKDESNLEFLVRYQDTVDYNSNFSIVRENGSTLKNINGWAFVREINGEAKLLLTINEKTEVYSLPGELNTNAPYPDQGTIVENTSLYPNPADDQIKLHYQLSGNETARIKIYNATGHLKEKLKVGPDFNHIKLDVSGYQAGNYFYKISVKGQIRDKGKFVVVD